MTGRHTRSRAFLITLASGLLGLALAIAPARAEQADHRQAEPEASTGSTSGELSTAKTYMVSSANGLATEAGRAMLAKGGSAVDAAIATQLVLGLVEPQSSGLGGGAFIVHWNETTKSLSALDGRETAPRTAKPDRFLVDGKPMPFDEAVNSGLSIGTPGVPRLLEEAHKRHGKLPWKELFEPAIHLARDGFPVSQRLNLLLRWNGADIFAADARALYFDEGGSPRPQGYLLKNEAYAKTLEALRDGGAARFYEGPVADAIVSAAANAKGQASDLTAADLAAYKVEERAPICAPYRTFRICGMGPPSSGGVATLQIMTLLEGFDIGSSPKDAMATRALHLIIEAERLAYADRDRYLADPAFVPVPSDGLLDPTYLSERRKLIDPEAAMARPEPGTPRGLEKHAFGLDQTHEVPGTSHISVIDGEGNTVALTTTIEGAFGSGQFAAGFLLNNELTDFSFRPEDRNGRPIANRVEPGKRPRSTMAPLIVFDDKGRVFATLGSPGGSRIILYVVKALVALIDWKLDAYAAVSLPNFGSTGGDVDLELTWSSLLRAIALKSYGHGINADLMNSGLHVVVNRGTHLEGAADPRREGKALGD